MFRKIVVLSCQHSSRFPPLFPTKKTTVLKKLPPSIQEKVKTNLAPAYTPKGIPSSSDAGAVSIEQQRTITFPFESTPPLTTLFHHSSPRSDIPKTVPLGPTGSLAETADAPLPKNKIEIAETYPAAKPSNKPYHGSFQSAKETLPAPPREAKSSSLKSTAKRLTPPPLKASRYSREIFTNAVQMPQKLKRDEVETKSEQRIPPKLTSPIVKVKNPFNISTYLESISFPVASWDCEGFYIPQQILAKMERLSSVIGYNQLLPFQYSIHFCNKLLDPSPTHRMFLFEPIDFRASPDRVEASILENLEKFLNHLLQGLEKSRSILVYDDSFEKSVLSVLGNIFPDYKQRLDLHGKSIVNIQLPLINGTVKVDGGCRLKNAARQLIPEHMDSEVCLEDGKMAMNTFFVLASKSMERQRSLIEQLRRYCRQDSYLTLCLAHYLFRRFDKTLELPEKQVSGLGVDRVDATSATSEEERTVPLWEGKNDVEAILKGIGLEHSDLEDPAPSDYERDNIYLIPQAPKIQSTRVRRKPQQAKAKPIEEIIEPVEISEPPPPPSLTKHTPQKDRKSKEGISTSTEAKPIEEIIEPVEISEPPPPPSLIKHTDQKDLLSTEVILTNTNANKRLFERYFVDSKIISMEEGDFYKKIEEAFREKGGNNLCILWDNPGKSISEKGQIRTIVEFCKNHGFIVSLNIPYGKEGIIPATYAQLANVQRLSFLSSLVEKTLSKKSHVLIQNDQYFVSKLETKDNINFSVFLSRAPFRIGPQLRLHVNIKTKGAEFEGRAIDPSAVVVIKKRPHLRANLLASVNNAIRLPNGNELDSNAPLSMDLETARTQFNPTHEIPASMETETALEKVKDALHQFNRAGTFVDEWFVTEESAKNLIEAHRKCREGKSFQEGQKGFDAYLKSYLRKVSKTPSIPDSALAVRKYFERRKLPWPPGPNVRHAKMPYPGLPGLHSAAVLLFAKSTIDYSEKYQDQILDKCLAKSHDLKNFHIKFHGREGIVKSDYRTKNQVHLKLFDTGEVIVIIRDSNDKILSAKSDFIGEIPTDTILLSAGTHVQRIYLTQEGHKLSSKTIKLGHMKRIPKIAKRGFKAKLNRGVTVGSMFPVKGHESPRVVILCEGPEEAFTLKKLSEKKEVQDCLGLGDGQFSIVSITTLATKVVYPSTVEELIFVVDNDGYSSIYQEQMKVFEELSQRFKVRILMAFSNHSGQKMDFNDILVKYGVNEAANQAIKVVDYHASLFEDPTVPFQVSLQSKISQPIPNNEKDNQRLYKQFVLLKAEKKYDEILEQMDSNLLDFLTDEQKSEVYELQGDVFLNKGVRTQAFDCYERAYAELGNDRLYSLSRLNKKNSLIYKMGRASKKEIYFTFLTNRDGGFAQAQEYYDRFSQDVSIDGTPLGRRRELDFQYNEALLQKAKAIASHARLFLEEEKPAFAIRRYKESETIIDGVYQVPVPMSVRLKKRIADTQKNHWARLVVFEISQNAPMPLRVKLRAYVKNELKGKTDFTIKKEISQILVADKALTADFVVKHNNLLNNTLKKYVECFKMFSRIIGPDVHLILDRSTHLSPDLEKRDQLWRAKGYDILIEEMLGSMVHIIRNHFPQKKAELWEKVSNEIGFKKEIRMRYFSEGDK